MSPRAGLFVTFEGVEGCGKTTQLARAADFLSQAGREVVATREPGGTPLGAELRGLLLGFAGQLDARAELLLLFADRRQHLEETIRPALARGAVVLCDRYTDASRAYQGAGRRLGEALVDRLHQDIRGLTPRRTYLFDCPPEVALTRAAVRDAGRKDRFEREGLPFHRRVRAAYLRRAKAEPRRFLVLDARPGPDEVFAALRADLSWLVARR